LVAGRAFRGEIQASLQYSLPLVDSATFEMNYGHLLAIRVSQQSNDGPQQLTPVETIVAGLVLAALGTAALAFRAKLSEVYGLDIRGRGVSTRGLMYFISCIAVPAVFAVIGGLMVVVGITDV
jgi:hypothetical protein